MSDTFDFWTHGVNVQVEFTEGRGLFVRRTSGGTYIRQNPGTSNWFHFAIPSASKLDDDNVDIRYARLRGNIGNDAAITQVDIREASSGNTATIIYSDDRLNIRGTTFDQLFDMRDRRLRGALVVSAFVVFESGSDPNERQLMFTAAGASQEEHT